MRQSRFDEEQKIGILREVQAGSSVKTVCAKRNISEQTCYAWKKKYGRMDVRSSFLIAEAFGVTHCHPGER
jgi:putative transposase